MSPSHVVEPTYASIKLKLLSGTWRGGERLEAHRLAGELGVSITPVRDSLNRLVGERLVEQRPGDGFHVVRLNEQDLRDLLDFSWAVLRLAVRKSAAVPGLSPEQDATDRVAQLAAMFRHLAATSENRVLVETIASLNDRLHMVRMLDPLLLHDTESELDALLALCRNGAPSAIWDEALTAFHARRRRLASRYVALLDRGLRPPP